MYKIVSLPAVGLFTRYAVLALTVLMLQGCDSGADTQPNDPGDPPPQTPPDTTAPSIPESLVATAVDHNRIDLSWSASTDAIGVAGYRIYRDDAQTELESVTTTTYSDTSVVADTQYSYTVRAFDEAGNLSEASAAASVTTPGEPPPQVSGLDSRPSNETCEAWPRPTGDAEIRLERFTSLTFDTPVGLLQAPGDDDRWFVIEQKGVVQQFSGTDPSTASPFIDIEDEVIDGGERGLLGMAFHPDFPEDPRVFLSYTTGSLISRISEFTTLNDGASVDHDSERTVLEIDQPQPNHNGGHIAFGPDGFLYIGMGDGGGSGDPNGNGQRLTTLLGKMLRIDVDGAQPYEIPAANPFEGNDLCDSGPRDDEECPEIYAWGFRNPWRWSFDRTSGDLWVADVGQNAYEEVNQVELGRNYGWRCREGAHDFEPDSAGCDDTPLIDPITEYSRDLGYSITGGYVYRGTQSTGLAGRYVFGDFGTGRIFAWIPEDGPEPTELLVSNLDISSFGEGNDGELYVVHHGGTLHRIVFSSGGGSGEAPALLSETGCVSTANPAQPAEGLIPYTINAPFWSDGAEKERWLALPNGQTMLSQTDDDWELPNGSVLMKHFRVGSRLIETRLFMRHPDGAWGGFTYEWNDEQTDATLLQGGAERDIGGAEPWIFPSETQCLQCHTSVAGRSLGLETAQLNRDHTYPSTGRVANQLYTLSHIDMLTPPVANPATRPSMPDPADDSAPLNDRARAYLHTNCSFCHRPGGTTPSNMDLLYTTDLADTQTCNIEPQSGDLDLGAEARLIAPGEAANSIIVERMNRRDEHAMPPLGSNQIDAAGVALIEAWINGLSGC